MNEFVKKVDKVNIKNIAILSFSVYVNYTIKLCKCNKYSRLKCQTKKKTVSQLNYNQKTKSFIKNEKNLVPSRRIPIVAVVGKGNVGKSTLVNRLASAFDDGSIVYDTTGVTRDKLYKKASWRDYEYLITDTGGFVFNSSKKDLFSDEVKEQALKAIQEANLVIFVTDSQTEINSEDMELARFLKFQKTPVILAVNKCENIKEFDSNTYKYRTLGFGEAIPISAIHGTNTGELLDKMISYLPKTCLPYDDNIPSIALIGRPNAGKSSVLNFLHGKKKSIVSNLPGTTRDSIDSFISGGSNFNVYNLIDTAGIRRKKTIEYGPEFFMINRTFKAIQKSDCVLIVIDASMGITDQDQKLAERINKQGKACVILLNKWDKVSPENRNDYENFKELVRYSLPSIAWANILFISAMDGTRCEKILNFVDLAIDQYNRRVPTSILNEVVQEAIKWKQPPTIKGNKQGKIYYCTQINEKPPTIAIFVNEPDLFNESYKRYIESQFRSGLGFQGTCLRILWTKKK